jgi:hypothetical protein
LASALPSARGRLAVGSAVLGTLALALAAWLYAPRDRGGAGDLRGLRIVLVDDSASVVAPRAWSSWIDGVLASQAEAAARAGEELCTIVFGSEVRRAPDGIPRRMEDRIAGARETRLAAALKAVRSLASDARRASCRLVYLGDDTYTGEDPEPLLADLRARGVLFERVTLPPRTAGEVAVGPLILPREVEAGAPIPIDAEVFYAPAQGETPRSNIEILLLRCTATGLSDERFEVQVPAGLAPDSSGYLRWRIRRDLPPAPPGLVTIRLEGSRFVSATDIDMQAWSEGTVRCRGSLVVGVLTDERRMFPESRPSRFAPIRSDPGLQVEELWPDQVGGRLDSLDALVTCDLPPDVLPEHVLGSFVRGGGGWLCFAGDGFLRGFESTLLPLLPPDEKPEPRDVVVLADRSGSMSGEPFEHVREAMLALIQAASARDAVLVRFFGEKLADPIELKAADDPRDPPRILREAIDRFSSGGEPGGSTAIARALEAFAAARESSGREALAFLLTDGRDTVDANAKERCEKVLPRLLAAKVRLVVVAAGAEPERGLLSTLLAPGEILRNAGELSTSYQALAEIFRREVTADRVREGPALRVLPSQALLDPSAPATLGSEVLRAMKPETLDEWPSIQRYARAKAVPDAEVLWASGKGEPLLAVHRVGLGATSACAFAPVPGWGEDWAKRSDLWAPLVRALARGKRELAPRARIDGDSFTVEDLPPDAPAQLEALVFAADARTGDAPAVRIALSAPTSGADPRRIRTARWPSGAEIAREGPASGGFPHVEIRAVPEGSTWEPIDLPLATPHAPEFVLPRPRLRADAFSPSREGTGSSPPRRAPRSHPAAPWVLISGLLLLTLAGLGGAFARRGT